ncbi:MAG TPA: hypothetical protein VMU59_14185 [Caulobacteraceae bacterium]|nr:hypothetical protein [Caulobacteraceae bacterium]
MTAKAPPALSARNKTLLGTAVIIGISIPVAGRMFTDWLFSPPAPVSAPAPVKPVGPPTLSSLSPDIKSVTVDGDFLFIDAEISAASNDGYVERMADVVEPVAKAFKSGVADNVAGVKSVAITFDTPVVDRLGNKSDGQLVTMGFSASDLKAAHYENLGPYSIMALTNHVQFADQDAVDGVAAWCVKNAPVGASFCKAMLAQ